LLEELSLNLETLQTRIILQEQWIIIIIRLPITTRVLPILARQRDLILRLEKLHTQTGTDMPRNMTMHKPRAWVVCGEGKDDPALTRKERDVPAGRILEVQVRRVGLLVEDTGASAEDEEVVARRDISTVDR
jgi:hypothetical protein